MAATFHYPKTDEERISELKAQVQSKIYQVFGAPSRAFLEFDAADNSILSLGEFIAGMRKYGPACVLAVEPCVPTSTHAHPVYACACAWLCVCVCACVRVCVCVFRCRFRRHGLSISRSDAATMFAPYARAHRNQLTLTEFNRFCSSGVCSRRHEQAGSVDHRLTPFAVCCLLVVRSKPLAPQVAALP